MHRHVLAITLVALVAAAPSGNAQLTDVTAPWALDLRLATSHSQAHRPSLANYRQAAPISPARRAITHVLAGAMIGTLVGMVVPNDRPLGVDCVRPEDPPSACPASQDNSDEPIFAGTLLGAGAGLLIYLVRARSEAEPF